MISSVEKRNILVQSIVQNWGQEEKLFKKLEEIVYEFLMDQLPSTELLPTVTHRPKSLLSMIKTAISKKKKYEDIHDKLGFRIVCHFKSELPVIKNFIEKYFHVVRYESKADKLKFDQLGYASDHYDVKINPALSFFSGYSAYEKFIFEIQVRTICQHAWADVEHSLSYKQELAVDESSQRKIFRLTSLLEICDDEFDVVNRHLLSLPENRIFNVLSKIEGKFYKYAKRTFDKEIAYKNISILISVFEDESELLSEMKKLDVFFSENDVRIEQIFLERRKELDINIFFSQPEIFLIWFLVDHYEHNLIRVWKNHFDLHDLNDLAIWWGKSLILPE